MPYTKRNLITLILLVLSCLTSVTIEANANQANNGQTVLNIVGWDVYADPQNNNKTIGYEEFERQHSVTIEFTPLSNLDDIINAAELKNKYDVILISNEGNKWGRRDYFLTKY